MSSAQYAYVGPVSGELLSLGGAVLVHDDPAEMAWLMPTMRVIRLPKADMGRPLMRLRDHPDLAAVSWPLNREEFR
ncbi:hypothetical protein [Micromonospora sp. NBC_00421]|uniref:hypothetical protein n=1 Tax=Micromonospora sp. NBC_00421 TaxID=2975976 RepID=UPI002E1A4857